MSDPAYSRGLSGPPYLQNTYYAAQPSGEGSNFAIANNTLYGVPFYCFQDQQFDSMAIEVMVADGGAGAMALGVYDYLPDGFPGRLVVEGTANPSTSTTGDKGVTINTILRGGAWYLLAMNTKVVSGSPAVRGLRCHDYRGFWGVGGAPSGDENFYVKSDHTYDGSLPDPFSQTNITPAGIVSTGSTERGPMICIRTNWS